MAVDNMIQDPLFMFSQAPSPLFLGPEGLATNHTQPTNQAAAAPSPISSQSQRRTRIRKTNSPSCNLCRRRKIKCDRADPCSHCVRSGSACISSAPSGAARGRKGGRRKADSELLDRIAKLENLVKNIEGGTGVTAPRAVPDLVNGDRAATNEAETSVPRAQPSDPVLEAPKEGLDRYLGGSLWISLSEEIHGMREVLNQSSDEEEDDGEATPKSNSPGESNFVICAPDLLPDMRVALKHPTGSQVQTLHSLFMVKVDPVVKILHGPSLRRYFVEGSGEIDCSPGPKGWDALKFAIYYTATTSLTPDECFQQLGEDKSVLVRSMRFSTELALARADFVNTEDMSTLQAMVLYLLAVRSNDNSRRTWTLISLAVRIAHAFGLHREKCGDQEGSRQRPFMREMRRRLWWQICLLDRQASADRGSDPIITTNSFSTHLPLNVNDDDLIPNHPVEVSPREAFTDITFALMCHEVFDVERRLNYVPAGDFGKALESTDDPWVHRRGWVIDGQRRVENKYLRHCDATIPFQRYTLLVADIMLATMWLFTYRPLQKHPSSPTSVTVPPPGILHLSVEVLEKSIQIALDSSGVSFQWISSIWVQWHALAVVIAELCVQSQGPTVERAWRVVNVVFEEIARHVADSYKGKLWRPIKKMMNKAQAVRKKQLESAAAVSGSLHSGSASKSAGTPVAWINNQSLNTQSHDSNGTSMDAGANLLFTPNDPAQQVPQAGTGSEPTSFNWDQWLATGPSVPIDYPNELDQMAWTNWETFIDDFQATGESPPRLDGAIPPPMNMW